MRHPPVRREALLLPALLGALVLARGGAHAIDGVAHIGSGLDAAAWKLPVSGPVDDVRCDVAAVERANADQLYAILDKLANTTYFRLMQINMEGRCTFWGDQPEKKCNKTLPPVDGDSEDVQGGGGGLPKKKKACDLNLGGNKVKAPPVSRPPPGMLGGFQPPSAPAAKIVTPDDRITMNTQRVREDATQSDYWVDLCRTIPTNASDYINLQLNPERWTGYNGSHVWQALYTENCFRSSLEDMSFSERVLYRMLSGMHASINIHISEAYYPPSKLRPNWEPNLERFARHFGDSPERLKNLHFAYVVLLRALRRATPFLYNFPFTAGEDAEEDKRTMQLVQRLLDADAMQAGSPVAEAFDERRMFAAPGSSAPSTSVAREEDLVALKAKFKGVFQNVSAVLDCVSCQKCRLHGKIQLLGLGTAFKMLLLPEDLLASSVSRAELVALFNTLHKFGHALRSVPHLMEQYRAKLTAAASAPPAAAAAERRQQQSYSSAAAGGGVEVAWGAVDAGVGAIAAAAAKGVVDRKSEEAMLDALLGREDDVLLLAKHYALARPERFIEHVRRAVANPSRVPSRSSAGALSAGAGAAQVGGDVDAVVIGGGLAGLSAALTVLDAGGRVVVLEKMGHLGGNSAWASSGVNAVDVNDTKTQDSVDIFTADVVKAAGRGDNPLIRVLTEGSVDSLAWLRSRLAENLNLDLVGQMGGHSKARTHRPSSGLAGSAMIFAIQKQLEKYMLPPAGGGAAPLELMKWTRATKLIKEGDEVVGVEYAVVTAKDQNTAVRTGAVRAPHVLVATGGYASDYTQDSLLSKHRPDLLSYATTNNKGTTGDGHKLALAVGAKAVDLDDVQVHPTGFHNPADPSNKVKTLAAEITRGEGAILLHRGGGRFVNELGGRDYVTGRMLDVAKESPPVTESDGSDGKLLFALVMNSKGAGKTAKHIDLYTKKKLLTKFDSLKDLAAWSYWNASVSEASIRSTLSAYDQDAARGSDAWGKLYFHNTPFTDDGPYYAGLVTPVIHYCMGGVAISADGSVLREDGAPIKGLYAAGEVIGGLHGKNRLGGNALSECVVFGRVIGNRIASALSSSSSSASAAPPSSSREGFSLGDAPAESPAGEAGEVSRGGDGAKVISTAELAKHNTEESCWVSIDDKVYDFTDFLDEHPAGADAILKYAGRDGTEIFHAIHTAEMLEDFQAIGTLGKADEEVPSFEAPSFEAPSFEAPAPPSPSVESFEPPSFEIPVF